MYYCCSPGVWLSHKPFAYSIQIGTSVGRKSDSLYGSRGHGTYMVELSVWQVNMLGILYYMMHIESLCGGANIHKTV